MDRSDNRICKDMANSDEITIDDIKAYLDKLILLECKIGHQIKYPSLDPFDFESNDIISIQNATKKIAQFIGLTNYLFIVGGKNQKQNTAGNIELDQQKVVFIEIAPQHSLFPDSVLTILSHEVTHKYMEINDLYQKNRTNSEKLEIDEEIFTDITAIYLGLGKLMVNGSQFETQDGSTKTIHSIGYISQFKMLFVYRLICAMRNIPHYDYERGLTDASLEKLRVIERTYSEYFNSDYHNIEKKEELRKKYLAKIRTAQTELSMINKYHLFFEKVFLNSIEKYLKKSHIELKQSFNESQSLKGISQFNPCLNFLNSIKCLWETDYGLSHYSKETEREIKIYKKISKLINENNDPPYELFNVVKCWNCGTRMKLPQDKKYLIAICPNCKYEFVVDTSIEGISEKGIFSKIFR